MLAAQDQLAGDLRLLAPLAVRRAARLKPGERKRSRHSAPRCPSGRHARRPASRQRTRQRAARSPYSRPRDRLDRVVRRTRAACPAGHSPRIVDGAGGWIAPCSRGRAGEPMRTVLSKLHTGLKRAGYLFKATALACVLGVIEMVQTQRGRRLLGALTLVA